MDLEQDGVGVAVDEDAAHFLDVAALLALAPELVAAAAEVDGPAGAHRLLVTLRGSSRPASAPRRCRRPGRWPAPGRRLCRNRWSSSSPQYVNQAEDLVRSGRLSRGPRGTPVRQEARSPATWPPAFSISWQPACIVPPVASRSSTSSTRGPWPTPSMWTCSSACRTPGRTASEWVRYGSLPGLRSGTSGLLQLQGQRGGEQEAARLGGGDGVDRPAAVMGGTAGRWPAWNAAGVGQQRRDVLEQDARLGKIGDVADVAARGP